MMGRRGGLGKKIGILLILLVLGILILGVIFSQEDGESKTPGDEENLSISDEDVGQSLPYVLARLNGSVNDIYQDENILYISLYKSDPNASKSWVYLYVYDLDKEEFIDKILVEEGEYTRVPSYQILTVSNGKIYLYNQVSEGVILYIPLINFVTIRSGGSFDIKIIDLTSGEAIGSYRLDIEPTLAVSQDMIYTYKVDSGKTLILKGYNLNNGSLEIELYSDLENIEYLSDLYLVYSSFDNGVLTAIFATYEANYDLGSMKLYHIIFRYDSISEMINIDVYPSAIFGAYGSLHAATASVEGNNYYIFMAYSLTSGNKTLYAYTVESRRLSDGSLNWEFSDKFIRGERNGSAYISSYVDDGVFYVSWTFFAAYKDGEKLFSKSPWGGIYNIPTLFVIIPTKVYQGGGGFYEVDGSIYVPWIKRVKGSGIKGLSLYRVTISGLEQIYDLYQMGYMGSLFVSYGSKLYFVGYHSDGYSILSRLI